MDKFVKDLINTYHTRDPFVLAKCLGIHVKFEDLGRLNGYYHEVNGVKVIALNQRLVEHDARFTAAHELGHALLHEGVNVLFLNAYTEYSTGTLEREANVFAAFLLITDEEVEDSKNLSVPQIMEMYGFGEQLVFDRFISMY